MAAGRCLLAGGKLQVVSGLFEPGPCRGEQEPWVVRFAQVCSRLCPAACVPGPLCPAFLPRTHSPLARLPLRRRATFPEHWAICIWCIRRRISLTFLPPASDNLGRGNYVTINAGRWRVYNVFTRSQCLCSNIEESLAKFYADRCQTYTIQPNNLKVHLTKSQGF